MDRNKYLIKNVGILTICNFASKFLIILLVPIYTAILSTSEYGTYDLVESTVTLLFPILSLNIVDGVVRFALDKDIKKEKVASIGFALVLLSSIMFSIVIFTIRLLRIELFSSLKGLEIYIVFYYLSYVFFQLHIQLAKGLEQVKVLGIAGALNTAAMVLFNLLFLMILKIGLPGLFLSTIFAQLIASLFIGVKIGICRLVHVRYLDQVLAQKMLLYSVPLIATTIGWWINSTADKYLVTMMIGISANGIISVSYKIPQIINGLQTIFIQAWQISAVKEYGSKDTPQFYGGTFIVINLLMSIACSILICLTKFLSSIFFANDFFQAWEYVPFLLVSSVFNCASGLLGPILSANKDSKAMMNSAIIGSIVNIIGNYILIKNIGIQGAAIATLISSCVIYVVRKHAVADLIEINEYYRVLGTWGLLITQGILRIYVDNLLFQILIISLIILLNFRKVKEIIMRVLNFIFKIGGC